MFLVLTLICWGWLGDQRIALASLYAWGPGDAAAALIGKRYGKTKIGKDKKKTLEGSLAMLILSTLSVFVILAWQSSAPLPTITAVALLTGAASAGAELMDLSGFDTYFCPAAAMTVLCLCRFLLGPIV